MLTPIYLTCTILEQTSHESILLPHNLPAYLPFHKLTRSLHRSQAIACDIIMAFMIGLYGGREVQSISEAVVVLPPIRAVHLFMLTAEKCKAFQRLLCCCHQLELQYRPHATEKSNACWGYCAVIIGWSRNIKRAYHGELRHVSMDVMLIALAVAGYQLYLLSRSEKYLLGVRADGIRYVVWLNEPGVPWTRISRMAHVASSALRPASASPMWHIKSCVMHARRISNILCLGMDTLCWHSEAEARPVWIRHCHVVVTVSTDESFVQIR